MSLVDIRWNQPRIKVLWLEYSQKNDFFYESSGEDVISAESIICPVCHLFLHTPLVAYLISGFFGRACVFKRLVQAAPSMGGLCPANVPLLS